MLINSDVFKALHILNNEVVHGRDCVEKLAWQIVTLWCFGVDILSSMNHTLRAIMNYRYCCLLGSVLKGAEVLSVVPCFIKVL